MCNIASTNNPNKEIELDPDCFVCEFFDILQLTIAKWVDTLGKSTFAGAVDLRNPLESLVNYAHYPLRNEYCRLRSQGVPAQSAITRLVKLPKPAALPDVVSVDLAVNSIVGRWEAMLSPVKGRPVFYAHIPRLIRYLIPLMARQEREVVLVTEANLENEQIELPPNVTLIRFVDSGCRLFNNEFLELNFPLFFSFVNTISLLDHCLQPPEFTCVFGCQTQSRIWATLCNSRGAETICYQHGWPAFMHAGFSNLPFKRLVTWGKSFSDLWHRYNPTIKCESIGYPFPRATDISGACITFFLQEPYFAATENTQLKLCALINATAKAYSNRIVQYRAHPESSLSQKFRELIGNSVNIVDVTAEPIEQVYASTRVAVAHYSSTILESCIHGCTPIVVNFTTGWEYNPDVVREKLGFMARNEHDFFRKLPEALVYRASETIIHNWFSA